MIGRELVLPGDTICASGGHTKHQTYCGRHLQAARQVWPEGRRCGLREGGVAQDLLCVLSRRRRLQNTKLTKTIEARLEAARQVEGGVAQDLLCADAGVPQLVAKPRVEPLRVLRTNQVEYDFLNQFDSNQCELEAN